MRACGDDDDNDDDDNDDDDDDDDNDDDDIAAVVFDVVVVGFKKPCFSLFAADDDNDAAVVSVVSLIILFGITFVTSPNVRFFDDDVVAVGVSVVAAVSVVFDSLISSLISMIELSDFTVWRKNVWIPFHLNPFGGFGMSFGMMMTLSISSCTNDTKSVITSEYFNILLYHFNM